MMCFHLTKFLFSHLPQQPVYLVRVLYLRWQEIVFSYFWHDLLYCYDSRSTNFDLGGARIGQFLFRIDKFREVFIILQYINMSENLRNSVVRKHSQFFRFRESSIVFDISIGSDKVSAEDLCTFVEKDLAPFKNGFVSESRKLLDYQVYKSYTVKIGG